MRRWSIPVVKRHSLYYKTAIPSSSFGEAHPLALIHWSSSNQWLHQRCSIWHQSRSYAQKTLAPPWSQQVSDSGWEPGLDSAKLSDEPFQDLLSEGARYSIHDVTALDRESSVTSNKDRDSRLVERPKYQFDYELWAILLRYRMGAYGDRGIRSIWTFLVRRDRLRLLPADWPSQDALWSIFVSLGLRDHEFLERIGKHAKQLWQARKLRRASLYVEVIGGLFNCGSSEAAPSFSNIMHAGTSITSEELLKVFLQACTSADPRALEHFWIICDSVANHKIYGDVIAILCEQERVDEAMATHSHLIFRHDGPRTFQDIEPLVRRIARDDLDLSAFIRQLEEAGLSFSGRVQRLYDSVKRSSFGISREDVDLATNKTFGVRRSRISDAFAARFFATKSFSFEFALNGLRLLGLDELGPLSLRQIALQAASAASIRQRLITIDEMRIDTGGSAYSRVIRQLAKEGEDSLLMDVVRCDQHPDVFEERQIQFELLSGYHQTKDWRQLNRTLAILNTWGNSSQHAPNGMLRSSLMRKDWPEVTKIVHQIHRDNGKISGANIILMHQSILRPRTATRRVPVTAASFQDLVYLITLWQNSLQRGTYVPANAWREPLRRLGMMGRWVDLAKTCVWLCCFYSPIEVVSTTDCLAGNSTILPMEPGGAKRGQLSDLQDIFSPALQRAVVEWGFLAGLRARQVTKDAERIMIKKRNALSEVPWIRGIELLCRLQVHYRVRLHDAAIRSACQERLRQLFSYRGRSKLRYNREARSTNKAKLHFYIRWINRVYGQNLLDQRDPRTLLSILTKRPARSGETPKSLRSMWKPLRLGQKSTSTQEDANEDGISEDEDDFVMYRDLFHASWEDYRPRMQKDRI